MGKYKKKYSKMVWFQRTFIVCYRELFKQYKIRYSADFKSVAMTSKKENKDFPILIFIISRTSKNVYKTVFVKAEKTIIKTFGKADEVLTYVKKQSEVLNKKNKES